VSANSSEEITNTSGVRPSAWPAITPRQKYKALASGV